MKKLWGSVNECYEAEVVLSLLFTHFKVFRLNLHLITRFMLLLGALMSSFLCGLYE